MPDVFVIGYLAPSGHVIYRTTARLFPGANWVPTPLTDRKVRRDRDVAKWWKASYDEFVKLLDASNPRGALTDPARSPDAKIFKALHSLMNPEKYKPANGTTPNDLCTLIADGVVELQQGLVAALATQRDVKGLGAALSRLRDASFSIAMCSVAKLENATRREPLSETLNQLFLRDRAQVLYEMVGDPPADCRFGGRDHQRHFANATTTGLRVEADKFDFPVLVRRLSSQFAQIQDNLKGGTLKPRQRKAEVSHRRKLILQFAVAAQELGNATEHLSATDAASKRAGNAAALCAVFAEGIRGVLELAPRPGDQERTTGVPDHAGLELFGSLKAADIHDEAKRREDPNDSTYDPTDPGRFDEVSLAPA